MLPDSVECAAADAAMLHNAGFRKKLESSTCVDVSTSDMASISTNRKTHRN